MRTRHYRSALALVVGFLTIIGGVPVVQTGLELFRNERVQFTDIFRRPMTAAHLREFERALEENSWIQRRVRPLMQTFWFVTMGETGAKAVRGRDGWLFYRPDLRYLVERPSTHPDHAVRAGDKARPLDASDGAVAVMVRFREQLRERGIELVIVPVPVKPHIYPDRATRRVTSLSGAWTTRTYDVLKQLREHGVATVDLRRAFLEARSADEAARVAGPLYLSQDTHWTPRGVELAAEVVADELRRRRWAPERSKSFRTERVLVNRWGDILEMMQIPALQEAYPLQRIECRQVIDPALGPLIPGPADRPGAYQYPGQQATILVLGDSFCRIYQYPEPASLGEHVAEDTGPGRSSGTKRLLPGSAGFVSHLALALQSPVDAIVSDGGAATDVRRKLSTHPEILEGKRVVIWVLVERDLALGPAAWSDVPLPVKLD